MDNFADLSGVIIRETGEICRLGVKSGNIAHILVASIQAERSTARVVFPVHANPALRATLSQDST